MIRNKSSGGLYWDKKGDTEVSLRNLRWGEHCLLSDKQIHKETMAEKPEDISNNLLN